MQVAVKVNGSSKVKAQDTKSDKESVRGHAEDSVALYFEGLRDVIDVMDKCISLVSEERALDTNGSDVFVAVSFD